MPGPAPTAAAPLWSPCACTGRDSFDVPPFPSCHEPAAPQHQTPPAITAQVCRSPVATALAWPARLPSATGTGVVRCASVPSPSCPDSLLPQHEIEPAASAQLWP